MTDILKGVLKKKPNSYVYVVRTDLKERISFLILAICHNLFALFI